MSNERPHGILKNTNSGVEIPATFRAKSLHFLEVTIDGSTSSNGFEHSDGWIFEPDPKPLPTTPGLYQDTSNGGSIEHAVTYRYSRHGWVDSLNNAHLNEDALKRLREVHGAGHLVRLIREEV